MTNKRFIELFDKRRKGLLSESEAYELNEWIGHSDHYKEIFERLNDEEYLKKTVSQLAKARNEDWQIVLEKHPELNREQATVLNIFRERAIGIKRYVAAAAAIILIGVTVYWFMIANQVDKEKQASISEKVVHEVPAPDITKARITLANGQVVELNTLTSGVLAVQGNINVIKTDEGHISYKASSIAGSLEEGYNTLSNPRGSKIVSITLSDGTKAWLNSESSMKYPVTFSDHERRIELSGEAYFEVAKDTKKQFVVKSKDVSTVVLGTHFNVNNYANEGSIKVTLLEGSVDVKSPSPKGEEFRVRLVPGQQAVAKVYTPTGRVDSEGGATLNIDYSPDLEQVMAWKNGTFYFSGENLEAVMKQLARWYDMEVEYEGNVQSKRFGGMISRNKNLGEVLRVLELNDVHFRIEGKKIIVMK